MRAPDDHVSKTCAFTLAAVAAHTPLATLITTIRLKQCARKLRRLVDRTSRNPGVSAAKLPPQTRHLLDSVGHIISIQGADGKLEYVSPNWERYTGLGPSERLTFDRRTIVHPDDHSVLDRQSRETARSPLQMNRCELRVRAADGTYRWFLATTAGLIDADETVGRRINVLTDIDDLKRTQAAFGASESRYRALIESMPQMVWIGDEHAKIDFVNQRWLAYTGLPFVPGRPSQTVSIVHPDERTVLGHAHATLRSRRDVDCEMRLRRHDGTYIWHLVRTVPLGEDDAGVMKCIVTATDIEARKAAETALAQSTAELMHRVHHDPLTNLPNRTQLMDRLAATIAQASGDGTEVIVLFLDIDHFKSVNDTLGHNAGDQLLVEAAARISATLRVDDIASRFGGDEFVLVCPVAGGEDAVLVAERVQAAVATPIDLNGKRVIVSSSIGISVFPHDGSSAVDLVQKADAAMYSAKQSGRNAWRLFGTQTALPALPALDFEIELREAIAREEFVVYYQPIISLESGRPIGAEALVRWQHPQRGLLAPGEFIAFAESHGLIAPIGELVLDATCKFVRRLDLRPRDPFSIAVNVSARQFAKPGFVGTIAAAIASNGIEARRLEIEITESVVMDDAAAVIATLAALETLGVKLSIDDFGTGYSSLAYIKNFPIHTLKIDRSFITDIALNFTDQAIAKTIITLAHSLGMRVVAEGVETAEQLERLRLFGADCFQGYLVSRPLPAADFEEFLAGSRSVLKRSA